MKILQLGKYYHPHKGGIESHLQVLCNELTSRPGAEIDVVVCNSAPQTVSESVGGVRITRCRELFYAASTSLCPTMPLTLSQRKYDIIHIHYPHPMGVVSYLASLKPTSHRVVISYHSDVVRQKNLLKLYAPLMHHVMDRASAIVCASPQYLNSSQALNRYHSKCRIIPYGIDVAQFTCTPVVREGAERLRTRYGAPILLAVGRLIYYKGFEYAIRAMEHVRPDARLVLVGDGPLRPQLIALAKGCGVAERVHFVGSVGDMELVQYYFASDIFIFPSIARSEAFGIAQLEAMACERPVVNTSLDSGVPFVSRDRESGITVPAKDPIALARAINDLLSDPIAARRLGAAGRRRVEAEFSKEAMSSRMLDLYREVLAN